ncbi:uncharacterized protein TRAVEDRAFT_31734 [Trametes versicolor FP-101664 SS1]|uniref:uncharacterized protein n=1 Tax=Trametes versicolor (strain FP-101664) TaxID=717944 RepID=UPI0004621510|nr:uncharacterized protein TRAVEDRAFT_31734 [Trametes versicolor FP-101664 SS1]EIW53770.1 hypothetical protein TRAVEDRAFT_31734 [Trametes versicolor FP-101664 SS1]
MDRHNKFLNLGSRYKPRYTIRIRPHLTTFPRPPRMSATQLHLCILSSICPHLLRNPRQATTPQPKPSRPLALALVPTP